MVIVAFPRGRRGFTLVELIFAIVVIGLTVVTIPTILISNARHTQRNLLQEAVLMAAAKMGQNLAFRWDENSWDENGTLDKTEAVNVASGDDDLDRTTYGELYDNNDTTLSDFRIGHFLQPLHRRMNPAETAAARAASNIGDDGDYDDIDDIVAYTDTIDSTALTAAGLYGQGYKDDYNITGTVRYVSDITDYSLSTIAYDFPATPSGTTAATATNIKMIEIRVDAGNTPENPDVLLRAYSCNIGETDYYKRSY